jgi:hypothetical protein
MAVRERVELVLSFAQLLHVNGQSTEASTGERDRLGNSLTR